MGNIENRPGHDAEPWLIKQHQEGKIDLDADVAVLGHHGSNNGTGRHMLETITQDWSVASADGNKHPATETLSRLQAANDGGVSVTDTHGRIAFTNGLQSIPENTDASTESWQIDQEIHGSAGPKPSAKNKTRSTNPKQK